MDLSREDVLTMWAMGYYKLGWRGWLAEKILIPAVNEALNK